MKRAILLMLITFYILIISGVSVNLHFCCGNLKTVSFFTSTAENSCCKSKKSTKGCCHETSTFIKVKEKHFSGDTVKLRLVQFHTSDLFSFEGFRFLSYLKNTEKNIENYHAPPPKFKTPIYLRNSVFII